jgi:hypothetical protein
MNGTPGRVVADDNVIAAKHTIIKTRPRREARRCLVTGGAGFVGSHLCEYLVNRGDYVSAKSEFVVAMQHLTTCLSLPGDLPG